MNLWYPCELVRMGLNAHMAVLTNIARHSNLVVQSMCFTDHSDERPNVSDELGSLRLLALQIN